MPCGTTQTLIARSTHPREFSCWVFKPPNSSFYPVHVWREFSPWHLHIHRTSHCIQTYTSQHCSLYLEELNQTHVYIRKYVFRNKINTETLKEGEKKSVFSNQAHQAPRQTDILYIQMVLPNDTRAP